MKANKGKGLTFVSYSPDAVQYEEQLNKYTAKRQYTSHDNAWQWTSVDTLKEMNITHDISLIFANSPSLFTLHYM